MPNLRKIFLAICVVKLQCLRFAVATGHRPYIDPEEINYALERALQDLDDLLELENNLNDCDGGILSTDTPSPEVRHYGRGGNRRSLEMDTYSYVLQQATKYLKRSLVLTNDQVRTILPQVDLSKGSDDYQEFLGKCSSLNDPGNCDASSLYRTANGSCNNIANPTWGMALTCLDRILPAFYSDGVQSVRKAEDGGSLQNSRKVSTYMHDDVDRKAQNITLMVMQWGQFIDHDVTLSPMVRTRKFGDFIDCCPSGNNSHPQCSPISIPEDDFFYRPLGKSCLNFVRSQSCSSDCSLGPRSQVNVLSAFIDASNMYGIDEDETNSLRELSGGRLRVDKIYRVGDLLPKEPLGDNNQCTRETEEYNCFLSGEERVNEQPGLTSMHTIWLRQHNRIAKQLHYLDPDLSDEDLFQIARRIVGAQMQHITYNEFLPVVLGDAARVQNNLLSAAPGRSVYDPSTNPAILAEFSTAAYRFGHTLLPNKLPLPSTDGSDRSSELDLTENYFNAESVLSGKLPSMMSGLASGPSMKFDRFVVNAVNSHVYQVTGQPSGLDLIAINVQRGRDHGLQSYPHYVSKCSGRNVTSFDDLNFVMDPNEVYRLKGVYKSVYDIDLFSGGLCESPRDGAVVGPTFACIMGLQFNRLKFGDRFFYEHEDSNGAVTFTDDQLQEIRKTTLGRVLCENAGLDDINKNVFVLGSPVVDCSSLPGLHLGAFVNKDDASS